MLPAAGCALSPMTGNMYTGSTNGATLPFSGRTDTPAPALTALVLSNASGDWHVGPFTNITPNGGVPLYGPYNDGYDSVNYYTFNFTSKPLNTTQWPAGGLARLQLRGKFNGSTTVGDMYTFDSEAPACFLSQPAGTTWRMMGVNCRTPYLGSKLITVVSVEPTPADVRGTEILYLGAGGDHSALTSPSQNIDPQDHEAETSNYYAVIDAPGTLQDFKNRHGFPTSEVHAIYYNKGDLGLARDMHCKRYTPVVPPPAPPKPPVTACYVTNYGRSPIGNGLAPEFGTLDPQIALDQAIYGHSTGLGFPIATVAMVHDPSDADNPVQFMVYDESEFLDPYAALDNPGLFALADADDDPQNLVHVGSNANINVPDNCLACHGVSSDYDRSASGPVSVTGATFLPFDPESMVFSANNATYSEANTLPKLKALNALVWDTSPPQAVIELLKGMYPAKSSPGPKNLLSNFDPTFIPAGWQSADKVANQVYKEIVKPYCRTCHVSAHSGLDWDSFPEFQDMLPVVTTALCGTMDFVMPHAEQTQNLFWKSPARAHFVNAFDITGPCAP